MPPTRLLVRAALKLRAVCIRHAASAVVKSFRDRLGPYQTALETARGSLAEAVSDPGAGRLLPLRRQLHGLMRAFQHNAEQILRDAEQPAAQVPDLRSFVEELRQLEEEFGGLELDLKKKTLGVSTDAIELEGVYLGAFRIQLGWDISRYDGGTPHFNVIAENPNPPSSNEAVTHPHVRDQSLCAGDATAPIERALAQGRIVDAFFLVRSVLTHYNPKSAHVQLEDWDSGNCRECSSSVSADDLSVCERCGYEFCNDCISTCSCCEVSCCHECELRCSVCQGWHCSKCRRRSARSGRDCCRSCLRKCAKCGANVARDELDASSELCPTCRPKEAGAPEVIPAPAEAVIPSSPLPTENDHECTIPTAAN